MELRSPRPFTFAGFNAFNTSYVHFLEERGILVSGLNPVARTNVAPEIAAPAEPVVYAFSCTVASHSPDRSFVVAGSGELPEGSLDPHDVVRRGENSADALVEKARFVLGIMDRRLSALGASWQDAGAVDVYTVHNIHPLLASMIVPQTGNARHGIVWYYSRPPITSIEYEMDLRGCAREIVLGR